MLLYWVVALMEIINTSFSVLQIVSMNPVTSE